MDLNPGPSYAYVSRVDVFQIPPTYPVYRQQVFGGGGGGQSEFLVSDLKPFNRYHLSIFAIDRRSLATSKPFTLEVQTGVANGNHDEKVISSCAQAYFWSHLTSETRLQQIFSKKVSAPIRQD